MKKLNLKIILAIAILFYSAKSFSQTTTTTILYDASSNLSTTKCNVFDPPVNVGGKLHTGVIGGATFSTANGLTLPTNYTFSSGQTNRTDYRISYSFKSGYAYRIEVTTFGTASNSTAYPFLGAALFTTGGLPYTSTSCGAGDIAGFPQLGTVFIIQVNNTPTLYSPSSANFTSPNNYDYLVLEATCSAAQDISDLLYIQKIKIVETPPVSFTLPATTSVPCGSTTAKTFTVTNVYSTTGVTNHNWNLGTTPNNWLYNGVAAPATVSTGIANSINLTPACGTVPKNISATVTANLTAYSTNTSTVSITPPVMSIDNNNPICTSQNYSITGFPSCNASVVWSASPTGIVTPNTSTSTTPTFTKAASGNVTLTATVTACGVVQPALTKAVRVGGYSSGDYNITGPSSSCKNSTVNFSTNSLPGATNYIWFWPSGWTYNSGQGTTSLSVRTNTVSGAVGVRVANACDAGVAQVSNL